MDYFTSREQEAFLRETYQARCREEQDRHRQRMTRIHPPNRLYPAHRPQEPDRIFLVEEGKVYLGEVSDRTRCPDSAVAGGGSYGVDVQYVEKVQQFIQRHPHYMVVFQMEQGYSHRAGTYPARMVSSEGEELWLRTSA